MDDRTAREDRAERERAAALAQSSEMMMWGALARNESFAQTRAHYQCIAFSVEPENRPPIAHWERYECRQDLVEKFEADEAKKAEREKKKAHSSTSSSKHSSKTSQQRRAPEKASQKANIGSKSTTHGSTTMDVDGDEDGESADEDK